MDTEFHYWMTGLVAHRAGFSEAEAEVIAYSSEYIDENDVSYSIVDKHTGAEYINYMSQTLNILKPKDTLMRIYPIFHFIPGDPEAATARRRDGKMHWLNTTPDGEYANQIIDAAFKASEDTRLFRIGIASHSYVDTWAHQNFIGWYDYFNDIDLKVGAAIGHAIAGCHPDWVAHIWTDNRLLQSEISNRDRFIEAAKALYQKYCGYQVSIGKLDNVSSWPAVEKELIAIMGQTYSGDDCRYAESRLRSYKQRLHWFPDFDEARWFDQAIETDVRGLKDLKSGLLAGITLFRDKYYWRPDQDKTKTNWYRFQEAVKEQERLGIQLLSGRFRNMGMDLAVI
ncbi:MAG: hypothetical protein HY849_08825 [Nitrosomonadales bacterium]|nr:hypothetical protein [Nitrosomonadales bacterium]